MTSQGVLGFTYYNNGNMWTAGTHTFTYTPQNQVETAAVPGVLETYAYNADDERVRKTDGTSTTYYIRGLNGQLLTEWKDPGTQNGHIRDYIYLGSRLVSAVSRPSTDDPVGAPNVSTATHRFATNWLAPAGSGGDATTSSGVTAAARKSMHPDMPMAGLRIGVQASAATLDTFSTGPVYWSVTETPKQGGVHLEFEIERRPFSDPAEILGISEGGFGTSINDALRLFITSGGELVLKQHGGRATAETIWTSSALALDTRHTLELRFGFNSNPGPYAAPNPPYEDLTSWVQIVLNDQVISVYGIPGGAWTSQESNPQGVDHWNGTHGLSRVKIKTPGAANGLLMSVSRAGLVARPTDTPVLSVYGNSWRTTLIQADGPGTYSQWTGGQPDWRARSFVATNGGFQSGVWAAVTSTGAGQKISYRMASMLSRGITGDIGTVLVGVRLQFVGSGTQVFIRRNGVETILTNFALNTTQNMWYRVSNGGWSPTDTIEVGLTSGSGNNYLNAVALIVEHNTPEPAPLKDTSARVLTYSYAGNGTAQTIDFGMDQLPTALSVVSTDGGVSPLWWWNSRQGAASMRQQGTTFSRLWPQKGRLHVVHDPGSDSVNAVGKNYKVIALFDPAGRFVIPFGVSKPANNDNYVHNLRYPQTRELATDFTPDFVFGGAAFDSGSSDAGHTASYRGPGHGGDSTAALSAAQAPAADLIQVLDAGTVEFGTRVYHNFGDHAFWAGRVGDGVSSTRLMAVTSYVGTGTGSQSISLTLGGATPVFAIVVPTNAASKVYRVTGDTTGRDLNVANAVANSITAMSADQVTVGSALNANGVTYDVWAITTGFVTPK